MNIGIVKERYSRIKNQPRRKLEKDFHYSTYSFLMLLIFGGGAGGLLYWFDPFVAPEALAAIFGGLLGAGVLMALFPLWTIQVVALFLVLGLMGGYGRIQYPPAYVLAGLGVLLSASVQLVFHWDKVVVLRFGRFRRVRDAGIFILLPIIDRIADFVDTRIRVTDFSAERTLTRDNVPVHIDALCFWIDGNNTTSPESLFAFFLVGGVGDDNRTSFHLYFARDNNFISFL